MYSLCHLEGTSGNCGLNCRAFTSSECHIPDEIVFNGSISYEDFIEAQIYYTSLKGTAMQHITEILAANIAAQAECNLTLIAIQEINWNNLQKDTLLYVADSLSDFVAGKGYKAYFAETHSTGFRVYNNGRTEATSNVSNGMVETSIATYALPATKYLAVTGK
jgi:hypothetical protein